jgi:hypothetical protein
VSRVSNVVEARGGSRIQSRAYRLHADAAAEREKNSGGQNARIGSISLVIFTLFAPYRHL